MKQTTNHQSARRVPQPATNYAEALDQFALLKSMDGGDVNGICHSQLLTHGHATDRALVLIHGMTNCPRQFAQLAPLFFERGYNVLLPRQPRNGLADVDTTALADMTLGEMTDFCHQIVDIARGLGRQVTVVGISAGGTLAAWIAQFRGDVDAAVPIAPLFGLLPNLPILNTSANFATMRLLLLAPNIMTQTIRPFTAGPPQSYRGFSSRGLATTMRLGQRIYRVAGAAPPKARSILLMLNPVDPAVNNTLSLSTLRRWNQHGVHARTYMFPSDPKLIHDMIDPEQVDQHIDVTYPILLDQITQL